MAYFTTSIAVVGGLCLAFAILYVFTGVRRPSDRALNLLFGFFALAYGGAIMTARAAFMSDTIGQFAAATRISGVIAASGFALLVWFVAIYTDVRPSAFLWTVTGAFAVVGTAGIVAPDLVLNVADGVGSITLPWGETVLMVREGTAPLEVLLLVALLASIIHIVVADIRQFRRGDRGEAIVLAVGIGWFIFAIVEENLVSLGVFDFVFLSDFGFLGFVVAMGLEMVNRGIDTESELIDYKDNLEKKVEVRSLELVSCWTGQRMGDCRKRDRQLRRKPPRRVPGRCFRLQRGQLDGWDCRRRGGPDLVHLAQTGRRTDEGGREIATGRPNRSSLRCGE